MTMKKLCKKTQFKSKTSFYITRFTQEILKFISEKYGLSQSDMISWTPFLVEGIAQRSLERRKRSIVTLRTLEQQIQSSISVMQSVAPHISLLLNYPSEMISQLVEAEANAVERKVISGLGVKTFDEGLLSTLKEPFESEPAYQRELEEFVGSDVVDMFNAFKKVTREDAEDELKDNEPRKDSD